MRVLIELRDSPCQDHLSSIDHYSSSIIHKLTFTKAAFDNHQKGFYDANLWGKIFSQRPIKSRAISASPSLRLIKKTFSTRREFNKFLRSFVAISSSRPAFCVGPFSRFMLQLSTPATASCSTDESQYLSN